MSQGGGINGGLNEYVDQLRNRVAELEEAERAHIERLELLSGAAFEGLMIHDNGVIVAVNQAFADMVRMDIRDLVGMNVTELATPESRALIEDRVAADSEEPYVVRGRRCDGSEIVCRVRGKSIVHRGKTLRASAVEDITMRERTAEALRESERRYRSLFDNAPDGIVIADVETGRVVTVNAEMARMLMRPPGSVVGIHQSELHPEWFREQARGNFAEHVASVLKRGRSDPMESVVLRSNGTEVPVEVQAQIVTVEGKNLIQGIFRDITERKRAEEALQFTQFAVDRASDGVLYLDVNGQIKYANHSACATLGYLHDELVGMSVTDIDIEMSADDYADLVSRVRCFGRLTLERTTRPKSGAPFPVEIVANHLRFRGTEYVVAFVRDLTERKRTEEALRFTQHSVDHAADGIAWVTQDGKFAYVNNWMCKKFGYTREELLRKTVLDVDGAISAAGFAELVDRLRNGDHVVTESTMRRRDGSLIPVEVTSSLMRFENKAHGVIFVRDMTERKRTEQALRLTQFAVDRAGDGVAWMDRQARFVYVNDAFCRSVRYSREELLSMSVYDIDIGLPRDSMSDPIGELRERRSIVYESYHRTKDGLVFPVEISGNYIQFGDQEYVVAFARDITERKRAEEALHLSEQRLRHLATRLRTVREEERGAIAREIHDQLGQALTGLKMDLSWVSDQLPGEATALRQRTREMHALIDDTIASVRELSTRLRPPLLDDLGLDAAMEWLASDFAEKSGIECFLDLERVAERLSGESRLAVFRILQEALTNTGRHAEAKNLWIRTRLGEDQFVMTVRDDGVGISEAAVVDPRSIGITGMRERAASLGGEVFIARMAEGGTIVTLRVPLEAGNA